VLAGIWEGKKKCHPGDDCFWRGSIPICKWFLPTANTSISHHAVNLSARNICWYYRLYNYNVLHKCHIHISHSWPLKLVFPTFTFFPWDNFSRCFCTHFAVFKHTPSIWRSMIVGKLKYFVNWLAGPWTWGGFPYQNDLVWKRPCNEYNVLFFYLATKARIISFTQDLNHPPSFRGSPQRMGNVWV